ncbi:MAG: hypothetical protein R3C49_10675 [Planctomycetaceae bacterium]
MNDLIQLLTFLTIGGLAGLILIRFAPHLCARFTAYSLSPDRSTLFLIAAIFFSIGSVLGFVEGNVVTGTLCLLLSVLEVTALIMALLRKRSV